MTDLEKAEARIAELEAEVDHLREIAYGEGLSPPPKNWGVPPPKSWGAD